MCHRILLVEDDLVLRETLSDALALEGYDVTTAAEGIAATELVFSRHFDLVVLDLMLPGRGGLEILKELRAEKHSVAVLLLTVRNDENDKVIGFELGADDYVTKPFGLRELLARIAALLRRAGVKGTARGARGPTRFRIGDADVDLGSYQIVRAGNAQALSPKEAGILRILSAAGGRAVARSEFLRELWGDDAAVTDRTIDTHVLNLRHKLEPGGGAPRYLVTVHGVGYRLVLAENEV